MKILSLLMAAALLSESTQSPVKEQDKIAVKKPVKAAFYQIEDLIQEREESAKSYLQFFRNADLRTGIYYLKAGARDDQSPHSEDEIYHVLSGKAQFTAGEEEREVTTGSVIFVAKNVEHRFHHIEEDLTILVFFASSQE